MPKAQYSAFPVLWSQEMRWLPDSHFILVRTEAAQHLSEADPGAIYEEHLHVVMILTISPERTLQSAKVPNASAKSENRMILFAAADCV